MPKSVYFNGHKLFQLIGQLIIFSLVVSGKEGAEYVFLCQVIDVKIEIKVNQNNWQNIRQGNDVFLKPVYFILLYWTRVL